MPFYKSISRLCFWFIFLNLLSAGILSAQIESDETERFPDDLYMEDDAIGSLGLSGFTIPNKRLHFIVGTSHEFSANAGQFKKRFGASSVGAVSPYGIYIGAEFQQSPKKLFFVHAAIPQKLSSKFNAQDHEISYNFITKHDLYYGSLLRLGMIYSLKRYYRLDFGVGGGAEIQMVSMKSKLLTDKNAISGSEIFITHDKKTAASAGVFGTAVLDYFVSKSISIQGKFQVNVRPFTTKIREQKVIRRADLYFGSYDYLWHTFSGFETGGVAMIFEIGSRWHF